MDQSTQNDIKSILDPEEAQELIDEAMESIKNTPIDLSKMTVDDRVKLSLAVSAYVRAAEKFEQASNDFNEACQKIRKIAPREAKFITAVSYSDYLVETKANGDFEINPITKI